LIVTSDTITKAVGLYSTHITNIMTTSQEINNARFSKDALEWDSNEKHVESTSKALEAIKRCVPAFKDGRNKGMIIPRQHVTNPKKALQSLTFWKLVAVLASCPLCWPRTCAASLVSTQQMA
jgi:hypothetical protein